MFKMRVMIVDGGGYDINGYGGRKFEVEGGWSMVRLLHCEGCQNKVKGE